MTGDSFGTFFLPGPTEVRTPVLAAMLQPMLPHRGAQFESLYDRCDRGLRSVFRTARPVYLASSSATGLMEGSVRCAPAGPVLALVNGAFSERYAQVARATGREVHEYTVPLGAVHDPAVVHEHLVRTAATCVTVAHSETSTGALNDVRALAGVAHANGAVILVDSVTGLAGALLETDRWDLDFVFTGSQKALALPPGLAFGVASAAFIEQAAARPHRGTYFDLVEFEKYAHKRQTPNTPALSLLYALDVQVADIAAEGIEARWARHAAMQAQTERWVAELAQELDPAFAMLAPAGARSPTVSCVRVPPGIVSSSIVRGTADRGFVIGSGYGALKDSTFRIGHMGDHSPTGLGACLAAVRDTIQAVISERR
jgi:aspartate aminotransferase-like enzyme